MKNVLEFKEVVNLLDKIFNIIEGHIVNSIPNASISELYLLSEAELVESNGFDPYKINNFIENIEETSLAGIADIKNSWIDFCFLAYHHN